MENLVVRKVEFNGKEIKAIKEKDKIFVSVRSVCENLGMNENQFKNQRDKINNDELLKVGRKFSPVDTGYGVKETMMLELDYLPIWLAKINPARFSEELKKELLIYQLKAKDVLADEFIGKRVVKKQVRYEPELNEIEDRVNKIRNNRDIIRKLLLEIASDYDWISQRSNLGYERAKTNYRETKRTHFILETKELTTDDIDKINVDRLKEIEKRLND